MGKLLKIITLGLFVSIVIYGVYSLHKFITEYRHVRKVPIENIDLSRVNDGKYAGEFIYNDFTYAVEVEVEDGRIIAVNIINNLKDNTYSTLAKQFVSRVVEKQSLQVDTVTYATTTSRALLKAIEKALKKGVER